MTPALSLRDVTLGYEGRPAVRHLDAEIAPGSLTALVGPNGAGKSTLLKAAAGALQPLGGAVSVAGGRVGYLPQQSELDTSFPIAVGDLAAMGLWHEVGAFGRVTRARRERIAAAVAAVGLGGLEDRPIGALSGGQRQRALFARLMLQDADVVLLDEPFTAIDARTTADLLEVVARWRGEGRTVLAALHDLETVRARFPRTMLLARGLVAHGETAQVLTPANLLRARAMGAEPGARAA